MNIGFLGLGVMGEPMARNLLKAGTPLTVWNRTPEKGSGLVAEGAKPAAAVSEVFETCGCVLLMLANGAAIDQALLRGSGAFPRLVRGRVIVNMGTVSPEFSLQLAQDVHAAGGTYVEAPVSGSRKPAEAGQLIGMVAGPEDTVEAVRALLKPVCVKTFACGMPPMALRMKLAVNLFLITMVSGLAESAHFARAQGLDMSLFREVLDSGPMASAVSRIKLSKLVQEDYSVQASITDVYMNNRLIYEEARRKGIPSPLLDVCHALFGETEAMGHGQLDMAAVVKAIARRAGT